MYERCPNCALRFEREEGYFLGAMYISYGLALVSIAVLAFLLWAVAHLVFLRAVFWGLIFFLPFAPMLTYLSRVLWIYFDQAVDPEKG